MMKTKALIALVSLVSGFALAGLEPDTITLTWARSDVSAYADTNAIYMAGVTYRLTNCVAYTTGTNAQDLTGLQVTIRAGDAGTNIQYTCTPQAGTNGLFDCDFHFPSWTPGAARGVTGQEGIELTIADTNTAVSVTYKARKLFTVTQPLH